jgi:hypothetical protein
MCNLVAVSFIENFNLRGLTHDNIESLRARKRKGIAVNYYGKLLFEIKFFSLTIKFFLFDIHDLKKRIRFI